MLLQVGVCNLCDAKRVKTSLGSCKNVSFSRVVRSPTHYYLLPAVVSLKCSFRALPL